MITIEDLTVGQVSGMIAAAVFIVQFLIPVALPVLLLGLLRPRSGAVTETATSWSVIGRFLHNSLWPLFLHTDSAASLQACKSAMFVSFFKAFMLLLVAVAAVVTPLGLHEGIVADTSPSASTFHYIKDTSAIGYGTPSRDTNNTWSRLCGSFLLVPCPNDYNNATVSDNSSTLSVSYDSDVYDSRIPPSVVDTFQSGAADFEQSVSSSFDIQYRTYSKSTIDDDGKAVTIDNGTARTIGSYQPMSSLVLNDAIVAIEGLIVDMEGGGIGFRNHSAPSWATYGSTWTEDILFVVPETVCVDTNLTLDFTVVKTRSESLKAKGMAWKPMITDRGGFANFNKSYPRWDIGDVQKNPNLWYRAYRAAWLRNAYSRAYMNLTNLANETTGVKAFRRIDSEVNKTFPLYFPDGSQASMFTIEPQSLTVATLFGDYLDGTEGQSNVSTVGNQSTTFNFDSKLPLYTNPYNINSSDWASIETLCRGQGGIDLANITHIASQCGILNGAARRVDGGKSSIFDPGSAWTLPMFSCMSTAKATIKTVSFRFNGTKDDLSSLEVVSLTDKAYPDDASKPLWAVENTDMFLKDGAPLWGLVSEERAKTLNLSTVRQESLYLPGRDPVMGWQNLPGTDFASIALDLTYKTGSSLDSPADYSGKSNLAMFKKWQELSETPETSAKILNLIWTDIAANMVVGTKSLLVPENENRKRDERSTPKTPVVTSYTRRIKYKYAYGIPAFVALVLAIAAFSSTLFFMLFAGAKPSTLRTFLQHTSAGRFLTAQASSTQASYANHTSYDRSASPSQQQGYTNAPTNVWVKGPGSQFFTLGAEGWVKNMPQTADYESKGARSSYSPVPNPNGY